SATLARALGGMLRVLGIDRNFVRSDQRARTERLVRVLSDAPPKAADLAAAAADEESGETWRLFRLLARAQSLYGAESLGPFIVSMTRGAAGVLTVLPPGRWGGCAPGPGSVPRVETPADLAAAARDHAGRAARD